MCVHYVDWPDGRFKLTWIPKAKAPVTCGRRFVPPADVARLHDTWHAIHPHMLAAALALQHELVGGGGDVP